MLAHHLPIEILSQIFEISAQSSFTSARSLSCVASWVHTLALPHLWSTLIVDSNTVTRDGNGPFVLQQSEEDTIPILPIPLLAASSATSNPSTLSYVRNLFFVACESAGSTAQIPEEREPTSVSFVAHIVPALLLQIQRLAIAPSDLLQIESAHPQWQAPKLTELYYMTPRQTKPNTLGPFHPFIKSARRATGTSPFAGITHLRLGIVDVAIEYELLLYGVMRRSMCALTHFACEYDGGQLHAWFGREARWEGGDIIRQLPAALLLNLNWGATAAAEGEDRRLQCVLILLRDVVEGPGCDREDPAPTDSDAWRENLNASRALARTQEALEKTSDERLLCMRLSAVRNEDWKMWAQLAREDRNIWDEAIARREQRRRRDT